MVKKKTKEMKDTGAAVPPESPPDKKTSEVSMAVCHSCRGTDFKVRKQTKTAVSLECLKCGLTTSVKGPVASARVSRDEVSFAVTQHLTMPGIDGDGEDDEGQPHKPTPKELGKRSFRFLVDADQDKTVTRAMESTRMMNFRDPKLRVKQWQGTALEMVCVDFLAGCDPAVLALVDAMESQIQSEAAEVLARSGGTTLTKRKLRKLRQIVRDAAGEKVSSRQVELYVPPADPAVEKAKQERAEAAAKKAESEEEETRIPDDGALLGAVRAAIKEYVEAFQAEHDMPFRYLAVEAEGYGDALKHWKDNGGFLLHVLGDKRTMTKTGKRPHMYLWIQDEGDEPLDIGPEYEDSIDLPNGVSFEVLELVPKSGEVDWEQPGCATGREKIDG